MADFLSDLQSALETVGANLQDWFSSIWDWFAGNASAIVSGYTAIATGIYDGLTDAFNYIKSALEYVGDKLKDAYEFIKIGFDTLGNWLQSGLSALGDMIRSGLDTLGGWLKSAYDWIAENVFNLGQWLWNGLAGFGAWIEAGLSYIGSSIYNFGNWVWNGLQWIGNVIWNGIKGIVDFFSNVFNTVLDSIKTWWDGTVDYLNNWWTSVVTSFRNKIKQVIVTNLSITGMYKSFEKFIETGKFSSLFGIVASPIVAYLTAEISDIIIPTPTEGATFELIPKAGVLGSMGISPSWTEPTKPTAPTKEDRYTTQFTEEKPTLTYPYEPSTAVPVAEGDAKKIVVTTTWQRVGTVGVRIRSATIKAPISNTANVWIAFKEDASPDEIFELSPGEAIDIAIDDLGKVWVRSETGTQIVQAIWVKV